MSRPVGAKNIDKTDFDRRLIAFVRRYCREHGYSPSWREIGAELGRPISVVHVACTRLQRQGLVTFLPGQPRTIRAASVKEGAEA